MGKDKAKDKGKRQGQGAGNSGAIRRFDGSRLAGAVAGSIVCTQHSSTQTGRAQIYPRDISSILSILQNTVQ